MGAHQTKTFQSGNSEAVRLPKGMGFGIGVDVRVEREPGGRIVLTPVVDEAEEKRKLLAALKAMALLPRPGAIERREPVEFRDD